MSQSIKKAFEHVVAVINGKPVVIVKIEVRPTPATARPA